ncbi:MAG TPA: hypothetical protein VHX37_00760 [Acidobacteriaceae bacterium]|nr:hypothetical protein [Acidobacteriaceae bacterium]
MTFLLASGSAVSAGARRPGTYVQRCRDVTLTASYLAEARPGAGPGFLFRIENQRTKAIRLMEPVPSSTDWYAQVGERWMWRASAGMGGSLVNALAPKGPMFAYRPAGGGDGQDAKVLTVPAHGAQEWIEAMRDDPAIAYRPSCAQCNYPGETRYQAVFAYAYMANAEGPASDLLRCGLRSAPVPMPPKGLAAAKP